MSTYTIKCINMSGKDRDFFFFTAPPDVGTVADPTIFTNAWVTRTASNREPIEISTTLDFYGWCGPGNTQIGGKTIVKQGVSTDVVTLGKKGGAKGSTFVTRYDKNRKHFAFGDQQPNSATAGCYEIQTGNDFTDSDNLLIGMAMDDPSGGALPVPVATISVDPGMSYNIAPIVKFYVAVGSTQLGEVIDYQEISTTAGLFDFTPTGAGAGMYYGEITYSNDGTFSQATYQDSPPAATPELGLPGWLEAIIAVATPILIQKGKDALKAALKSALAGINYTYGDVTFSSDGKTVTLTYKLPGTLAMRPPPSPQRPFSEICFSLDAKNEVINISFIPIGKSSTQDPSTPMLGGGNDTTLVGAINTAFTNAASSLPSGEKTTNIQTGVAT